MIGRLAIAQVLGSQGDPSLAVEVAGHVAPFESYPVLGFGVAVIAGPRALPRFLRLSNEVVVYAPRGYGVVERQSTLVRHGIEWRLLDATFVEWTLDTSLGYAVFVDDFEDTAAFDDEMEVGFGGSIGTSLLWRPTSTFLLGTGFRAQQYVTERITDDGWLELVLSLRVPLGRPP